MEIRSIREIPLKKQLLWALGFILISAYLISRALGGGDFDVYLSAARRLSEHGNIYSGDVVPGLNYLYSPLFALLLVPFSKLPFFVPELIWLFFSAFLLYRIWRIVAQQLNFNLLLNARETNIILFLSLGMIMRFLLSNFSMVQMNIFMLYASLESVLLIFKGKKLTGALLLALVINIKILPLPFIPYLIYRGEFKAAFFTLLFLLFSLFLPALILGYDYNSYLLHEWWFVINPQNKTVSMEVDNGPHSLTAFIPVLLTNTTGDMPFKRNFINLKYDQVIIILRICQLLLVALTLYFIRTFPFKKITSPYHQFWEISYILLITPLIFPHQQKYAFINLFPACAYIIFFLIVQSKKHFVDFSKRKYRLVIVLMIMVFTLTTLTTDGIIGRYLCNITQYYRIITIGTLALIIPLGLCKPNELPTTD